MDSCLNYVWRKFFVSFSWLVIVFIVWNCWSQFLVAQWPSLYSWCVILNTLIHYKFLNVLNRVQSCDDNNLLLGANFEEDYPLMKSYSNHLREEMEQIEEKTLTTEIGGQVVFKFELIPSDMKWMSSHLWELNNCATYFPPFANVNQTHKGAMVLLVALKPLGNHSSTPRDWPWQIKWKTQRKDLKIP